MKRSFIPTSSTVTLSSTPPPSPVMLPWLRATWMVMEAVTPVRCSEMKSQAVAVQEERPPAGLGGDRMERAGWSRGDGERRTEGWSKRQNVKEH